METTRTPADESRDVRVGRILSDFHDRKARGEAVSEAELLAAHPDLADELRPYLETLGELRPTHDPFDALITQGVLAKSDDPAYQARLGAYKIVEFVGRGGMGIVLKAYEENLNRIVALKILRPEFAEDDRAVERFAREAKAAGALRHANIVTVYAAGREDAAHFLAMEHIQGPTLAEIIRKQGPLPADTIRRVLRELLAGLKAAHDAGLIHRDIKSANILLDGLHQQVKIADFGLARIASAQTRLTISRSALGTAEYMSPEQARGDETIDHRTDLYSAGVVLYEMLTGRTPFAGGSPSVVIHRTLHDEPADPRTVNPAADSRLSALALRLMAKRPEDRFAAASDALDALNAGTRVQSPERRRKHRHNLVLAMSIAALGCGGVWLLSQFASVPGASQSGPQALPSSPNAEPSIARLWVEETDATAVRASYGDDPTPKVFHRFSSEVNRVWEPLLVDVDGTDRRIVVAGLDGPTDASNLFAFDAWGSELWRLDLSSSRNWPDCGPSARWCCSHLAVGNLDGEPGEELVAEAHDCNAYATRISIIDPRRGEIRSTFWHMGQMGDVRIEPDFFGPGRPAIIAWGEHNKLAGFGIPPPRPYECPPGEDRPRTRYAHVTVVMVLDPRKMDGLGPPRTRRKELQDIPPACPFAYAFLDMAPGVRSGAYIPPGKTELTDPSESDTGCINGVESLPRAVWGEASPWMRIDVGREGPAGGGAILTVNRNLELLTVEPHTAERTGLTDDYWRARWRLVIQNGEYVDWPGGDDTDI